MLTETISKTDGTSTTINYGWDQNGNLISKKSDDQTIDIQYGWNSANRLIKVTEGSKVTTYQYDGEDRRIGKVITDGTNTAETQYLIDSERNYDEIIVAKTRTTSGSNVGSWKEELYLYAPDGVGDLLLQSEAGTEHLYQDGKGSTRLVVNNNGTKTTFDYDAFGNPLAGINPQNHIKHRYVGEVLDEETGFYYFRARHYDPKIGRFISRDSFEGVKTTPISLNPYLYAHSDPVNGIDPSGYMNIQSIVAGMGNMMTIARTYITAITPAATAMGRVLVAVARTSVRAVANEIRRCARGKACAIPNLLVVGKDFRTAQDHIKEAQLGEGSNGRFITPVLKFLPHAKINVSTHGRKEWYNLKEVATCSTVNRQNAAAKFLVPQCDEYPFYASNQGGLAKWRLKKVSLKFIEGVDNITIGLYWKAVGNRSIKNKIMPYTVVAPMGPVSFWVSNNHYGGKKKK